MTVGEWLGLLLAREGLMKGLEPEPEDREQRLRVLNRIRDQIIEAPGSTDLRAVLDISIDEAIPQLAREVRWRLCRRLKKSFHEVEQIELDEAAEILDETRITSNSVR